MNTFTLDGVDFTEDSNIESITISHGLNESDKSFGYTASEEITLIGEGYEYLKKTYFTSCGDIENVLKAKVKIGQCDLTYLMDVQYEDVQLCLNRDGCPSIKISLTRLENECYKHLNETPFLDDGFAELEHPILWYVVAGGFVQNLLFILFPILAITLFSLTILFNLITLLCKAVEPLIDGVFAVINVAGDIGDFVFGEDSTKDEVIAAIEQNGGITFTDAQKAQLKGSKAECLQVLLDVAPNDSQQERDILCTMIGNAKESDDGISFSCPEFISFDSLVCGLYEYIAGTGYKARVPLLSHIFEYHMKQCGGSFESSILQDSAYRNAVMFTGEHGGGVKDIDEYISRDRWLTDTSIQLLDKYAQLWNAEYWFDGNVLHFEPIGFRESQLPVFPLTFDEIIDGEYSDVCIDFNIEDNAAYGRFEYSNDAIDQQGNKHLVAKAYDTIVEWNDEAANWKKGEYTRVVPFSRARFMYDRVTAEDKGFGFSLDLDNFRSGVGSIIVAPLRYLGGLALDRNGLDKAVSNASGLCGDRYRQSCDMIVHDDNSSLPKILILEDQSPTHDWYKDARVMSTPIAGTIFKDSNSLMYFDEDADFPELYKTHHYTRDPNLTGRETYEISGLKLDFDCETIDCDLAKFIADNPLGYKIKSQGKYLPVGYAVAEKTSITYADSDGISSISISDLKYSCV